MCIFLPVQNFVLLVQTKIKTTFRCSNLNLQCLSGTQRVSLFYNNATCTLKRHFLIDGLKESNLRCLNVGPQIGLFSLF